MTSDNSDISDIIHKLLSNETFFFEMIQLDFGNRVRLRIYQILLNLLEGSNAFEFYYNGRNERFSFKIHTKSKTNTIQKKISQILPNGRNVYKLFVFVF